jgi:hypothetical protein
VAVESSSNWIFRRRLRGWARAAGGLPPASPVPAAASEDFLPFLTGGVDGVAVETSAWGLASPVGGVAGAGRGDASVSTATVSAPAAGRDGAFAGGAGGVAFRRGAFRGACFTTCFTAFFGIFLAVFFVAFFGVALRAVVFFVAALRAAPLFGAALVPARFGGAFLAALRAVFRAACLRPGFFFAAAALRVVRFVGAFFVLFRAAFRPGAFLADFLAAAFLPVFRAALFVVFLRALALFALLPDFVLRPVFAAMAGSVRTTRGRPRRAVSSVSARACRT